MPEYEIEGGVPDEVAGILARSLTNKALVTFPSKEPAIGVGDYMQRIDAGLLESVEAAFLRIPGAFNLISTNSPESAKCLFKAGGFPWYLQGQIILLSPPGSQPPVFDRKTLFSVMEANLHSDFQMLSARGVHAMIYPGVDGDVVGFVSCSPAFESEILRALESEAIRGGFSWQVVAEDHMDL
ncbi:MAG: hypothetical protein J2P31_05400 [Blastocatellia bacterium]|nr:hypothetical protein [Blastocatellia bacterium]